MILIADSGSTKTDWALRLPDGAVRMMTTGGLNPVMQSEAEIEAVAASLRSLLEGGGEPLRVFFYGAGCTADRAPIMRRVLQRALSAIADDATVSVESDLLGAARALCGRAEGIACIIGTGSNSCLYDGRRIVANTPPLGYVLGDEGSGASLGKAFLNGIFKGSLSRELREEFLTDFGLTYDDVIERVYRRPLANRFLASVVNYIRKRQDNKELRLMVTSSFRSFIRLNVKPYERPDLPLNFVGGVAYSFSDELGEACMSEGFTIGRVVKAPISGLLEYHSA